MYHQPVRPVLFLPQCERKSPARIGTALVDAAPVPVPDIIKIYTAAGGGITVRYGFYEIYPAVREISPAAGTASDAPPAVSLNNGS